MSFSHELPVKLTAEEALKLLTSFLPHQWKSLAPDDIHVSRCQTGVNNEVYFVSRKSRSKSGKDAEADKDASAETVVVRLYSGIEKELSEEDLRHFSIDMRASVTEQLLMMQTLAHRGLGPEVLGVFEEGRVEQFIPCRKITLAEARDTNIARDIAVNMARIHSTPVPLKKPGYLFWDCIREGIDAMGKVKQFFEGHEDQKMRKIALHDYESDLTLLKPLLDMQHHRIVFINWDPHLDNICLRTQAQAGQLKSIVFDFEAGGCNMRGKDLGLFLVSRCGFFPHEDPDARLDSSESMQLFLQAYQQELLAQGQELDLDGMDSIRHLELESLVGAAVSCICFLAFLAFLVAKSPGSQGDMMAKLPFLFNGFTACMLAIRERFGDRGFE